MCCGIVGRSPERSVLEVQPKLAQSAPTLVQPGQGGQEPFPKALPAPSSEKFRRVQEYLSIHPNASARAVGHVLGMSDTTANKWMRKIRSAS
jgi:hypothetical protein